MDRDINILTKNKNSYRKMLLTYLLLNQFHYMSSDIQIINEK